MVRGLISESAEHSESICSTAFLICWDSMANDKFIENPVNGAERWASRLSASAGSGIIGSKGQSRDSIVDLFDSVVAANRDKVAAVCGDARLTYGVLNSRANYVAERLRSLGVRTDSFVAIYLDRSLDMLVAMVGILKAGGAYLPIDPMYPTTRVLEMLDDAKPVVILTTATLSAGIWEQISPLSVSALNIEELLAEAPADVPDSPAEAGGDDLAY